MSRPARMSILFQIEESMTLSPAAEATLAELRGGGARAAALLPPGQTAGDFPGADRFDELIELGEGSEGAAVWAAAGRHLRLERSVLVSSAFASLPAAREAGFALIVAVAPDTPRAPLLQAGADLAVASLDEVSRDLLDGWLGAGESRIPSALGDWGRLREGWRGREPALFLDFDGTLAPIVERPESARIDAEMRRVLERCAARWPVAVVSGRDRLDVQERLGLSGVTCAGSHGFDISGPEIALQREELEVYPERAARAAAALEEALDGFEGVQVEGKRFTVSVHWRRADPAEVPRIEAAVDRVLLDLGDDFTKAGGKKLFEVRPAYDWDKGRAVEWLRSAMELDPDTTLPAYIGDDVTDEDAFRALAGDGVGILVAEAPRETEASWHLRGPVEVRELLDLIAGLGPDEANRGG